MTTSVHTIAKFIVKNASLPVSNLKLQKLLYYAQGWNLGIHGEPIFAEQIEAWIHGPVVPAIFRQYRTFQWTPIVPEVEPVYLDDSTSSHVLDVLKAYGKLTAAQLEMLSHTETPWLHARKGLGPKESSNAVITHESMKRYFGKLAHG
jgi:uncharacterized phage-associated protein